MLSAYLYRVRRSLVHSPLSMIFGLFMIGLSVLMIAVPMMDTGEDAVVVSDSIKVGGITILLTVMAAFMYFTGLFSGVTGYSFADVNFHLAGPFTEKFNLVIAAVASFKVSFVFLFVLACQSAVIYMAVGIRGWAYVLLLGGAFLTMLISYVVGAFLGAVTCDDDKKRRLVTIISGVIIGIIALAAVAYAVYDEGSISAFRQLGTREMVGKVGSNVFFQVMPISGWVGMICSGILIKDMVFILIGTILSLGTLVIAVLLYANYDFDYYETAIEGAQRISDLKASRRAGVDADTANLNRKVKVGKETLTRGWGAGAFGARHQLENARSTKFFFVNKLAMMYRVICAIYSLMIIKDADTMKESVVSVMSMMLIMDVIIYGGGKTILEFNRPFIFLVPEKSSAKVLSCLVGDFPEMIFDSLVSAAILGLAVGFDIPILVTAFLLLFVIALVSQLTALLCLNLFKNLGRFALMFIRYFVIMGVIIVTLVPGIIIGMNVIGGGVAACFLVSTGVGLGLAALLLLATRGMVDRLELNA